MQKESAQAVPVRTFFDSIRHAHDAVIRARREQVHKGVQQRKDAERSERAQQKQMHVLQPEGEHDLLDERKRERDVDRRRDERQGAAPACGWSP